MTTHELRIRSNRYTANMSARRASAITAVSKLLVDMNRGQMLNSLDSKNKPLVSKITGSPNLSLAYSLRTRKQKPNLYLSGSFQRSMFFDINENAQTWFIDSMDEKSGLLTNNYGNNIFGINDTSRAKAITSKAVAKDYVRKVWGK